MANRARGRGLSVEGLAPLVAVPQADHVTPEVRRFGVLERAAAVGDRPVGEVLDLALLYRELHATLGRVDDGAHRDQGLASLAVERCVGQRLGVRDERLGVAGRQVTAVRAEYRLPGDLVVTRRVLGLSVPGERAIETREEAGMLTPKLVMYHGEADDVAHPALARRVETIEPDLFGREVEPRGVGVELELE